MPAKGYTSITVPEEVAARLEDIRRKRGERSIPQTIERLIEDEETAQGAAA